jgi:beta-phosphoglucomutase
MILDRKKVQAVIFDMDGVLFLSNGCHERAWRETFQSIGITDFSYAAIAGMRTDDALARVILEHGKQVENYDIEALTAKKRQLALQFLEAESEVAPESATLIAYLRKKYRLALASSASPKTVALFLKKSGYADAFEIVLDGSSVEHSKPAPDIYQLVLSKLGLRGECCVVVEDSGNGIRAAQDAGIPVIALSTIAEEVKKIKSLQPTVIVTMLSEIQKIL